MLMRSCSPAQSDAFVGGGLEFVASLLGGGSRDYPPGNLETLPDAKNCTSGNSRLSFVYGGLM